jgi:glutamate dehydrogenase
MLASARALRRVRVAGACQVHGTASTGKSWVPQNQAEVEKLMIKATAAELEDYNKKAAAEVVPWFFTKMPSSYFNLVDGEQRMLHIRALTALRDSGIPPELVLHHPESGKITFIQPAPGAALVADSALGSSWAEPGSSEGAFGGAGDSVPPAERGNATSTLLKNLMAVSKNKNPGPLSKINLFTSTDNTLMLNVFKFGGMGRYTGGGEGEAEAAAELEEYCARIMAGEAHAESVAVGAPDSNAGGRSNLMKRTPKPAACFAPGAMAEFLTRCTHDYVVTSNTRRLCLQREMYEEVIGTEGVSVQIEGGWDSGGSGIDSEAVGAADSEALHMITIAAANVQPRAHMIKLAQYLSLFDLDVQRTHLDVVDDPAGEGHVAMIRLLVASDDQQMTPTRWKKLATEIKRLKWLDDKVIDLVMNHTVDEAGTLDLPCSEVIVALCSMLHGPLAKVNQYAFARARIFDLVKDPRVLPHAAAIAQLFLDKFDPATHRADGGRMPAADLDAARAAIKKDLENNVEMEDARVLLNKMLDATAATLKTNAYVADRFALAMRLDPAILGVNEVVGTDVPFGSVFVHGRRFNGFHVRFRDIARGGLRVVLPQSSEQHALESARQYDEAYSLAFAQQLKNKDIPEGGSKAVALVDCPAEAGREEQFETDAEFRHYVMRKSVKAFSDAMLDMLSEHEHVRERIVDYYGEPELIYLGPDENVIPDDINWMIERAHKRGYPIPNAFMSSKPDAGINHKVYGVTSEGVAVFADVALHAAGFTPREPDSPFTVKITGGPDGDVAGNIINILNREYGSNVVIVAIADGTGCAEDPAGLDMGELIRLFQEEKPISHFAPAKLGAAGVLHDAGTADGARARNTMHNRVQCDVFIPAGGRPATVTEANWHEYLLEDGKTPSAPLIVEGANLFFTPAARQSLFEEAGVNIVKDSSANKCGVITSSYEIMASMMLEPEEFIANKEAIVSDTLVRLRELARVEAELLHREGSLNPTDALPLVSQRISEAITRVHDSISDALKLMPADDARRAPLMSLVEEHLPDALLEISRDRIVETVPKPYFDQIIAAALSCKIVYKEGLDYIDSLPDATLANIALSYLESEKQVTRLTELLEASDLAEKDEIAALLSRGGTRAGISLDRK